MAKNPFKSFKYNFWNQPPFQQPHIGGDSSNMWMIAYLTEQLAEMQSKLEKKDEKKPDDKKAKTITYLQAAAIMFLFAIPGGAVELLVLRGFGNAFLQALRFN